MLILKEKIWLMTLVILRDSTEKNIFAYVIWRDFAEMNAVVQMVMMINENIQD